MPLVILYCVEEKSVFFSFEVFLTGFFIRHCLSLKVNSDVILTPTYSCRVACDMQWFLSFQNLILMLNQLYDVSILSINPLNPELNPICYLLALLGAHHFLHVNRIRVK